MHILYVITQQDAGGAQKYVLDLAAYFHGSIAAGTEGNQLTQQANSRAIPFYPLPHMRRALNPYHDTLALLELMSLIKKLKPDVVHTNSSKAGVLGTLASWLCGIPTVFTAHGFQYLEPMSIFKKWFFWCCEFVCRPFRDFVITVSEYDRVTALHDLIITKKNSKTIYHGITPPTFLTPEAAKIKLSLPNSELYIGTIANLYRTKGIDVLLEAFAQARQTLPRAHLVIIGDGPERNKLVQLASRLSLTNHISFLGQLPNAAQYLRAFDLFVLPSRKEGFPYALLEALAAGLPIVATHVGGVAELVNKAAQIVPPNEPNLLAGALDQLLTNSESRNTLSKKALNQFKKFNLPPMLTATRAIYARLLE